MGLDMYLEARKYVSKFDYKADDNTPTAEYAGVLGAFPVGSDEFGDFAGANVSITVGYWRKANQIHNWFVQECAGGEDDCRPISVDSDKLRTLRATIEFLLSIKDEPNAEEQARKLLAPAEGFFFGTYEIDEWYWNDLERTKNILDKAISLAEDEGLDITYQASW